MKKEKIIREMKSIAEEAAPDQLDLWPAIQAQIEPEVSSHSSLNDSSFITWEAGSLLAQLKESSKNVLRGLLNPDRANFETNQERKSTMLKRFILIGSLGLAALLVVIFGLRSELARQFLQENFPLATVQEIENESLDMAINQVNEAGQILFETQDGAFVVNADGSGLLRLPLPPTWRQPRWSPDGQQIAFTALEQTDVFNLYVMDANGGNLIQLTDHVAEDQYPVWSPDGRRIAFTSRMMSDYHLYVVNSDGTDLVELKPEGDKTISPVGNLAPAWSPDGEQLAFISRQEKSMSIYRINADGSNSVRLTDERGFVTEATWSPDGEQLTFSSSPSPDPDEAQHLYLMNTDGSGKVNLTAGAGLTSAYAARWSPDGQQIAFSSGQRDDRGIYVINTGGTNLTRLTDESLPAWYGVWSPDGQRIAFFAGSDYDEAYLYVMKADGSNVTQLTEKPGLAAWLEWLPPNADPSRLQAIEATPSPVADASASASGYTAALNHGIQVNPRGDTAANIEHVKTLGLKWVKFQMAWKEVEPQPGQYEWSGWDALIGAYAANGIEVLLSIPKAPDWARPVDDDKTVEGPPADPAAYANFVAKVAERYRGQAQAIEIWDEQNLWYKSGGMGRIDAANYVQLLQQAYQAIKTVNPEMIVVSGGLTPAGNVAEAAVDDVEYLRQMYAHGLKGYFDALGAHPHGYNCPAMADWRTVTAEEATATNYLDPFENRHHSWCFLGALEAYRQVIVENGDGDKTIWPTEFGWGTSNNPTPGYGYVRDNTPEEQAEWTLDALEWADGREWVGPMFLWNLDYGLDGSYGQLGYFGIIGQPVYEALAGMSGQQTFKYPGWQYVEQAGLMQTLNLSQTVEGVTVTIEQAYADANLVIIAYNVQSPPDQRYDPGNLTLTAMTNIILPHIGGGFGNGQGDFVTPFNASPLQDQFEQLDLQLGVEVVEFVYPPEYDDLIEQFGGIREIPADKREDLPPPATGESLGPFEFEFSLPFHSGQTIAVNETVEAAGTAVTLESVIIASSGTQARLCVTPPVEWADYKDWLPFATITPNNGEAVTNMGSRIISQDENQECYRLFYFYPLANQPGEWTLTVTELVGSSKEKLGPQKRSAGPWVFRFMAP